MNNITASNFNGKKLLINNTNFFKSVTPKRESVKLLSEIIESISFLFNNETVRTEIDNVKSTAKREESTGKNIISNNKLTTTQKEVRGYKKYFLEALVVIICYSIYGGLPWSSSDKTESSKIEIITSKDVEDPAIASALKWSPNHASKEEIKALEQKFEIIKLNQSVNEEWGGITREAEVYIKQDVKNIPVLIKIWRLMLARRFLFGGMWDVKWRTIDDRYCDVSSPTDNHSLAFWVQGSLFVSDSSGNLKYQYENETVEESDEKLIDYYLGKRDDF